MVITVGRKAHFNAAHRLHNPKWSKEQNLQVYGKCNNPNFHGHNYTIVVRVTGEVDPETGYLIDLKIVKDLIQTLILDRFDHKNLNLDVEEFKNRIPTAENIAYICWNLLKPELPKQVSLKVTLYETARNFVEYSGD